MPESYYFALVVFLIIVIVWMMNSQSPEPQVAQKTPAMSQVAPQVTSQVTPKQTSVGGDTELSELWGQESGTPTQYVVVDSSPYYDYWNYGGWSPAYWRHRPYRPLFRPGPRFGGWRRGRW